MALETHTEFLSVDTPEGPHQMAWQMWQQSTMDDGPILVCVHGLTRNRHDFDVIAAAMTENYRVVTVDILGRGDSDWLIQPEHYGYPLYVSLMTQLLEHLTHATGETGFDWLGTSMGGLIGMMIAASPESPIERLILNDIGPEIPVAGLQRLSAYVGKAPLFSTLAEVEDYLRITSAGFGKLTDEQWHTMAGHAARQNESGQWQMAYDPEISRAFDGVNEDIDLTDVWQMVECPVLVIRGAESDLLTESGIERMCQRENTVQVTFSGAGHAPALMSEAEIKAIRDFLTS